MTDVLPPRSPEICKDPVADNTDVYAFVSPDRPDSVTLIANFIPFQNPQGGPNFYEFGDDVLYEIHVSNRGDGARRRHLPVPVPHRDPQRDDVPLQHRPDHRDRQPELEPPAVLLGHAGCSAASRPQALAGNLTVPPVNVGVRARTAATTASCSPRPRCTRSVATGGSSPASGRTASTSTSAASSTSACCVRSRCLHLIPSAAAVGVNGIQGLNVHTIAIQVPITDLTCGTGAPDRRDGPARRRSASGRPPAAAGSGCMTTAEGKSHSSGRYRQVSRLGKPLFNEVIIPMASKDRWNSEKPSDDSQFAKYVAHPELAGLLPVLYPGRVPEPRGLHQAARRPAGDPADRHPGRRGPGLPELHRDDPGGHAAAQRRRAADGRARTRSAWSAATWPGSRTAAG